MPAYTTTDTTAELRQSEIITDLVQFTYSPADGFAVDTKHAFSIVLTQDCDLLRDHELAANGKPRILNGVLLFELGPSAQAKLPGGDILRRIRRHGEERYHLLDAVPPSLDVLAVGLPELLVDFRRCFTMPAQEILRQCAAPESGSARRRCRLDSPYREHLQTRAAFYFQRVGLPEPPI